MSSTINYTRKRSLSQLTLIIKIIFIFMKTIRFFHQLITFSFY